MNLWWCAASTAAFFYLGYVIGWKRGADYTIAHFKAELAERARGRLNRDGA